MSNPAVSVLLPAYNAEAYLKEAIESILSQTFKDFELILLDDGSTDNTVKIAESFDDERIKIVRNSHIGLSCALNEGIKLAAGKYIARMDADDIACPERFQTQVEFLEANTDISIVGSLVKTFPVERVDYSYFAKGSENIKIMLLLRCMLVHPSVMFRKSDFVNNNLYYNPDLKQGGEDYDLWVRASKVLKIENIEKVLLNYRKHNAQVSKKSRICPADYKIWQAQLSDLGIMPSKRELLLHSIAASYDFYACNFYKSHLKCWFDKLISQNNKLGVYPKELFENILSEQYIWLTETQKTTIKDLFKYPGRIYRAIKKIGLINGFTK